MSQRAGRLMAAIRCLPDDHYVTFRKEQDEDGDRVLLTACVFQKAPEDGWASRGARFGHPPDAQSCADPCPPQFMHDDRVIFGVSSAMEEPKVLERLLIDAIDEYWGTP